MSSPLDLCSLNAAKAWLSIKDTNSDRLIEALITAGSRAIYGYLGRASLIPRAFTDRFDGQGNQRVYLKNYPVLSVSSVVVDGRTVQPSALPTANSPATAGWLLEPWDGTPPGSLQALDLEYIWYCIGRQNVIASYVAGYAIENEPWTVPGSPYSIAIAAPYGPWASDLGVTYASGTPFVKVPLSPTLGEYAVDTLGNYTFAAADTTANVEISYGFVPQDIFHACVEWVGERFQYRGRIGEVSKSLGGQETISFSQRPLSAAAQSALDPYRQTLVPI